MIATSASATRAWGALRGALKAGVILGGALLLLAMAESGPSKEEMQSQIDQLQETLTAREGELALTRLQLQRLNTIVHQSSRHDIPAGLARDIYEIALSEGIDPTLAFSLVRVESRFSPRAVSSAGAVGLTQVMPSTAFWLDPRVAYKDLFEGKTNLRLGFRYLRQMIELYGGNLDLALLAYNRGPGRVDEILRAGHDPSNGYNRAVLAGR